MGKKSATNNGFTVEDADRYAPTTWGRAASGKEPFEFETPSGQICLVKSLGMEDILRLDMLDTLDFFSKSLSEDDKKAGEKPKDEQTEFAKSMLKNFSKMEDTVNLVIKAAVIAPKIELPIAEPLRKDGVIYADTVPFTDRMAIFTEVFDVEGLSSFREETEAGVGHVSDEQVVPLPAE